MRINSMRRGEMAVMLGILAAALGLRLWGIGFGLPYTYHYDEQFYISGALNVGAGIIGKQSNPPGLINILFGEYGAFYLIGQLLGRFDSLAGFEAYYRSDPSAFYLLGRLTSAALGTLTVLGVYGLGRRLWGARAGLIGGGLLAVAFLHARDSHFATPDVTATFFVTMAMLASVAAAQAAEKAKKAGWLLALAGGLGGLALAVKWTTWPAALAIGLASFFVAHAARLDGGRRFGLGRWLKLAGLAGVVYLAVFCLASFEILLDPRAYWEYAMMEIRTGSQGGFSIWQIDAASGWLFYLKTLAWGLGSVLLAVGLAGGGGVALAAWKEKRADLAVLLAFPVLYFLYMGSTRHYFARYALPMIPFLVLWAGWAVEWGVKKAASFDYAQDAWRGAQDAGRDDQNAWRGVQEAGRGAQEGRRKRVQNLALAGFVLVLAAQPLISGLRFGQLMSRVDTRTEAKQWIEANLEEGAKIGVDWLFHTPLLASPDLDLPIPNSKRVYHVKVPSYNGLYQSGGVGEYRQAGYDYLIASSYLYEVRLISPQSQKTREKFYQDLESEYRLVKAFYPNEAGRAPRFIFDEIYGPAVSLWERERPGPVIKIYAVEGSAQP